jgi:hypothetical protein
LYFFSAAIHATGKGQQIGAADLVLAQQRFNQSLNIEILTLYSDFDVYRRFRRQPFCRVQL